MARKVRFPTSKLILENGIIDKKGEWGSFKKGTHYNYTVHYRGKEVGDMAVFQVKDRSKYSGLVFVNNVYVTDRFRGKGIGRFLYLNVLKEFGNICTYYHQASDDAQAVWRYLSKRFRHETDYFKDMLFVFRY